MLDYMKESIELALKYRDDIDEEFADTIILAMCRDVLNHYILLIPNERNHSDAKILSQIDGAEVFNKAGNLGFSFGLFELLKELNSVEEVMEHIEDRAIIIKKNEKVIDEFFQIMRVGDELTGTTSKRYLTRRHLDFRTDNMKHDVRKRINEYWEESSPMSKINVVGDYLDILIEKTIPVHYPERTFHERGPLDEKDFYEDAEEALIEELKKPNMSVIKGLKFSVLSCVFKLYEDNVSEYFGLIGRSYKEQFADMNNVILYGVPNSDTNNAEWLIKIRFDPRDFANRLIKRYIVI